MIAMFALVVRAACFAVAVVAVAAAATPVLAADDSLYRELGKREGIGRIIEFHVANMLADDRIKTKFDNTNMDRFRKLAAEHLCVVAGGPCEYTGRSLAAAHRGLALHNSDFNAVTEDLQAALDRAGIPYRTQNRLLARLAPTEHEVVTK